MKRRDLIIVEVGDDERLRGERVFDLTNAIGADAMLAKPVAIGAAILAQRGHHNGFTAETAQVVGDVARAAAPFAPHFTDLEANRQDMRLLGKDVTREAIR